jgi:hypothetical protein
VQCPRGAAHRCLTAPTQIGSRQGDRRFRDQKRDLYGRALVVMAAEQYASRLVVPSSQQHSPMRWPSHKDQARKALAKLAGPHLPVTLKQVEKAVAKAHAEHEKATSGRTTTSRAKGGVDEQPVAEPADTDALDRSCG